MVLEGQRWQWKYRATQSVNSLKLAGHQFRWSLVLVKKAALCLWSRVWLYFTPVGTFCFSFKESVLPVKLLLFGKWLLDYDQTLLLNLLFQISWFCCLVRNWDWIFRVSVCIVTSLTSSSYRFHRQHFNGFVWWTLLCRVRLITTHREYILLLWRL